MSTGYLVMYGVFSAILIALVLKIVRSFNHKRRDDALASRHRRAGRSSWRETGGASHRGSAMDSSPGFTYTPLVGVGYTYSGGAHEAPKGQSGPVVHTIGGGPGDGQGESSSASTGGDGGGDGGGGGGGD